jgi:hypothetical protein
MKRRRERLLVPRLTRAERLRAALSRVADTSSSEIAGTVDALQRLVDLEEAEASDASSRELVACIRSRLSAAKSAIDKLCAEGMRL